MGLGRWNCRALMKNGLFFSAGGSRGSMLVFLMPLVQKIPCGFPNGMASGIKCYVVSETRKQPLAGLLN